MEMILVEIMLDASNFQQTSQINGLKTMLQETLLPRG